MAKPYHTSDSDEWGTPSDLFDRLDRKWNFTLDPCANGARVLKFAWEAYTKRDDGLLISWAGHRVFCNPPYSQIDQWVAKAAAHKDDALIVMLIPARTDTKYWHEHIEGRARVEFIRGRLKFVRMDGGKATSAPFPSCLVYF